LSLKVLAVLLAVLLWIQVASQETVQMTRTAPVEFLDMPTDLEISNDYPRAVEVVLQTDRPRSLGNERISVMIDMRDATPGAAVVHLNENNLRGARDAEIVSITPARLRLQVEKTRSKEVDVKATLVGSPAEGYEVFEVRIVPPRVPLSGPQSRIEQVTQAHTEPISIDGLSAPLTVQVALDLEDTSLRFGSTDRVRTIVVIEEKRKAVEIAGVDVEVLPEGVSSRLLDRRVRLSGTVPISYTEALDPALFTATVDLTDLPSGTTVHELVPEVKIPKEYLKIFRLTGSSPEKIRVRRTG
jgi:YbbR domain-containing protein